MQPFITVSGVAAFLPRENIDTGAIAPSRYLRSPDEDLGKALFGDWRYHEDGSPRDDFILNGLPFTQSSFLVAGDNFGCGSSREAAVWALAQFGIRAVISSSFGDLFLENAFKNGLLPVALPAERLSALVKVLMAQPEAVVTVDLRSQQIEAGGERWAFDVNPFRRTALLEGLDEIGATLAYVDDIRAHQAADLQRRPWIYGRMEP
jgi:3-isopropylmalate/(R)-2-methylmalate dehydratase small subunit